MQRSLREHRAANRRVFRQPLVETRMRRQGGYRETFPLCNSVANIPPVCTCF